MVLDIFNGDNTHALIVTQMPFVPELNVIKKDWRSVDLTSRSAIPASIALA